MCVGHHIYRDVCQESQSLGGHYISIQYICQVIISLAHAPTPLIQKNILRILVQV